MVYAGFKSGKPILSPDKTTLDVISRSIKFSGAIRYPLEINIEGQTSLMQIINTNNIGINKVSRVTVINNIPNSE